MIEVKGNLWDIACDYWIITTNGVVKPNGHAVMGKGIAGQAKQKYPLLPKLLGAYIKEHGNIPAIFPVLKIITLPTKHHWRNKSDIELIKQGLIMITNFARIEGVKILAMTRPGCGSGGLTWDIVKPEIQQICNELAPGEYIVTDIG